MTTRCSKNVARLGFLDVRRAVFLQTEASITLSHLKAMTRSLDDILGPNRLAFIIIMRCFS